MYGTTCAPGITYSQVDLRTDPSQCHTCHRPVICRMRFLNLGGFGVMAQAGSHCRGWIKPMGDVVMASEESRLRWAAMTLLWTATAAPLPDRSWEGASSSSSVSSLSRFVVPRACRKTATSLLLLAPFPRNGHLCISRLRTVALRTIVGAIFTAPIASLERTTRQTYIFHRGPQLDITVSVV